MIYSRGTDEVKVIQVIETLSIRGDGDCKDGTAIRQVRKYWTFEGELLCEIDPDSGARALEVERDPYSAGHRVVT